MMNLVDLHTISFLNQFAHTSTTLNKILFYVSGSDLLTWGPVTALMWWTWFREGDGNGTRNRQLVISIIVSCIFLLVLFYAIQESGISVGFRPRPMWEHSFQMPDGVERPSIDSSWGTSSSFPSGHAAVLSAFSIGLLLISRPLGIFSLIYSCLVCLLRVFFGMHYLTDLIAGALIGVITIYAARSKFVESFIARPILNVSVNNPPIFYSGFFLISYGVATGFAEGRSLIHFLKSLHS